MISLTGGEGPVQSANSLHVGFANGTPAHDYALCAQRAFGARADYAKLAGLACGHPPASADAPPTVIIANRHAAPEFCSTRISAARVGTAANRNAIPLAR